ncbi:MAG: global cell cycle regulator GcrA-like protein [Alphaproteobacteria bacterium]|nr:global cell cycle regulator GcrA-like protein [Alphaproteobacteria bacterium]
MAWTDERVELLKRYWSEGLSASQIAGKMGGVTRNAVIGKVHRLGLSGRATPAQPKRGCDIGAAPAVVNEPAAPRTFDLEAAEADFIAPTSIDDGDFMTVATMKRNSCKWPVGDPASDDFHFCGDSTGPGKPYCAYHASLAFQPSQRRVEQASTTTARVPGHRRIAG